MMRPILCIAAVLALLATAPASAQELGTITVTAADGGTIAPDSSGSVEATVEVDCILIVENAPTRTVTVTGESPAFTVSETSFDLSPEACLVGQGSVSQVVALNLTPVMDAQAVVLQPVNITAALGAASDTAETTAAVAYRAGHTIDTDITFPATVRGGSLTFNVTISFAGNARSMVMFVDDQCDGCSVSGLRPVTAVPPADETIQVTFNAPEGIWGNRTFEFRHFSHYAPTEGTPGDPAAEQTESWTFVQDPEDDTETGGDGEDSPAAGLFVAVALLGAVAVLRRR